MNFKSNPLCKTYNAGNNFGNYGNFYYDGVPNVFKNF